MTQASPPRWYPPPPYAVPPYPPYPPAPPPPNGMAIAAVALGAVGLVLSWLPFLGLVLPVLALALGAAGLGRANATGPGRGPAVAGVVLGAVGLLVAVTVTTLFLFLWPRVSPCLDSRLGPHARAQCLRDHFGVPQPAPTPVVDGPQFSIRSIRPAGPA